MKKLTTVLTAIVMLFATSAFATDGDNVTAKVAAAFKTDFSQVNNVSWEKTSDFYFATFQFNNITVDAAYNEDGELVGTSRKIASTQLPLNLTLELSKKFGEYKVSAEASELTYEGQTSYYLTVENDRQVVKLKCNSNGEIDVESKVKKEPVKS